MRSLLVIVLIAGCGFFPEDDFTGKRPANGVSAWQDQGQIRLCLGNERVGPEASAVGGLCFGLNDGPEAPCERDDQCGTREACVCSRCTVQYCTSNGECGPGRACSFGEKRCGRACKSAEECPGEGEICSGGICKGRCDADDDCQTGEVCGSNGRCVVATCGKDEDCRPDERCRVQRQPRATAEPAIVLAGPADPVNTPPFVLYVEMADVAARTREIWRATSLDGFSFDFNPARPLVTDARAPSVVRDASGTHLYVELVDGIGLAEGPDGVIFDTPRVVVSGDYHAPAAALTPSGETIVYLEEGDGAAIALWDGGTPRRVLTPNQVTDPTFWRDVTRVASPSSLVVTGPLGEPTVYLWFDAFGAESGDSVQFGQVVPLPPNDSVGFAAAPLAQPGTFSLYPYNPVFDRVVVFLEHRAERAPSVVQAPGGREWLLYYEGFSTDGSEPDGIGLAVNPPRF